MRSTPRPQRRCPARAHKALARRAMEPVPFTEAERDLPFQSCDSEDYLEGIRAFLAKEKPAFKGR